MKARRYYVDRLVLTFADALPGTVADGTMVGLSYDKLLAATLVSGFQLVLRDHSEILLSYTVKDLGDLLSSGATMEPAISDGTNTLVVVTLHFDTPLVLRGPDTVSSLAIIVRDDMSQLLRFTALARGGVERDEVSDSVDISG